MEKYLRHIRHTNAFRNGNGRRLKKIIIIAVAALLLGAVILTILIILAFNWLFNRGSEQIQQTGQGIVEQVTPELKNPLALQSYIDGSQVDTQKLEQSFYDLPSQLQGIWLDQFKAQLDDLRAQAGISDEALQTLTALYDTLRQSTQ